MIFKMILRSFVFKLACVFLMGFMTFKAYRLYERRTDGFTLQKIQSDLPFSAKWDSPVSDQKIKEVNSILNQPFKYLGRGFQCYAFESDDGQYVIKFFRHQRLRLPWYSKYLPDFPILKELKAEKKQELLKRQTHLFSSFKLAYESVPTETAILYLHLNKTENRHKTVTLFDKVGTKHQVDLDNVEFIVQKKAMLVRSTIAKLMEQGKEAEAKKRLDQIFDLFLECGHKNVVDTDGALIRKDNLGFLNDRAIYIDAGKLVKRPEIVIKRRFAKDIKRLRPLEKWLEHKFPTLEKYFIEKKKKVVASYAVQNDLF